jgi:hypothetical protein
MDFLNSISFLNSIASKSYNIIWNTLYNKKDADDLTIDDSGIKNVIHDYKRIKTRYVVNKQIIRSDQKYTQELTNNIDFLKELNKDLDDDYINEWISNLEHRKTVMSTDLDVLIKSQKVFKEVSIKDNTQDIEIVTVCNVCMENKKDRSLDCGHIFCNICINKLNNCPTCRTDIDRNKIRNVFL